MGMMIDDLKQECNYCYREVDASGLEGFRCTNKTVNMETSWCRPKNANKPCSTCKYCKPRKEIGMKIDDIKHCLKVMVDCEVCEECNLYGTTGTDHCECDCVYGALDIIDKYQKIQEILNSASYTENGTVYSYTYDEDTRVKHIREVLEDGNNAE